MSASEECRDIMKKTIAVLFVAAAMRVVSAAPSVDAAFKAFWEAANVEEAAKAASDVVQSGATHSEVYWAQRLPGALAFLLGPR